MSGSWKTTLLGLLTSGAYLFLTNLQGGIKPKDAALAAGIALVGGFAKDHDKTGT